MSVDIEALKQELESHGWRLLWWLDGTAKMYPPGLNARFHVDGMESEADAALAAEILRKYGVNIDASGQVGEA